MSLPRPASAEGGPAGPAVDVRAFGAMGDGLADDTRALQAAIDSLATVAAQNEAGGGTVSVPPGTYRLTRTLTLNHGVTLRGAGHKATVLAADPNLVAPIVAFDREGVPPSADRVAVRDLLIRGSGAPGQVGIFLRNVHSWSISDCWVGWCDTGIHLVATWVGEVRNARATRNRTIGLLTKQSPDGGPHQIAFTASLFDHNDVGMMLDGSQYCWLFGCTLESNRVGGLLLSGVRNITVMAHFEANGVYNVAVSPDPERHRASRNVTISGCALSVSSKDRRVTGAVLGDVSEADVRNCWFLKRENAASRGIGVEIGGRATNVTVCPRSNTFQGLDRTVIVREGDRLAGPDTLNGGTLPVSLFGGWPDLARFARGAYVLDDPTWGIDAVLDRDVVGPVDLGDLPAGSRLRGTPGRRTRTIRASAASGPVAIALRRPGQTVENLRVETAGADGVLLDGPDQAALDLAVSHGSGAAVRVTGKAKGSYLRDIACDGSGPAVDDPAGVAHQDNVLAGS
jgi:hypothetical protein